MRALILSCPLIKHSWKRHVIPGALKNGWDVVSFGDEKTITTFDVYNLAVNHGADAFIWPRFGVNVLGDVKDLYARLRRQGIVSIAIHQDLYWDRPERAGFWKDDWWRADHVFTSDGDPSRDWESIDVNHHWFPPPIPDAFVGQGSYRDDLAYDLVFVGSVHPCHRGRQELLQWAKRKYRTKFAHFGASRKGELWGQDLTDLYASAKVVLGDSVPVYGTWSDRVPNTMGRGGVLIHPDTPLLRDTHGRHLGYYQRGDYKGLEALIGGLLALDEDRRKQLKLDIVNHVATGHTWSVRLEEIREVVGL